MQAAAKEARKLAGDAESDDEAGDGDGFGVEGAVRPLQPQVTVADNVSPKPLCSFPLMDETAQASLMVVT